MALDTNFGSLFEKLKVEDPWLPPSTWESIPSQNAASRRLRSARPDSSSSPSLATSVSEASLVRLALNALQGVESSLVSIEKLSASFYADPADRTYLGISSTWSRSSSTHALAKILNSIGCFGCLVFLLRKFVDHFTCLSSETISPGRQHSVSNVVADGKNGCGNIGEGDCPPYSLVNQAFAVAVGKIIEGYICALDTVCASVGLRRSANSVDPFVHSSEGRTPLTSVVHHEFTLLEVYLHTKELRTRIEALGNICNLQNLALSFSSSSFEELGAKASAQFVNFHRGGNLLSHLYGQLQVADPGHYILLKFLFLRSFEPYYSFIRSWIFKAEINDPYKEFIVEYVDSLEPHLYGKVGLPIELPLASIKEREGVTAPYFLKGFLSPIIRAGQQLQVLKKLLEFSAYVGTDNHTNDDFLPRWNGNSNSHMFCTTPLTFSKGYLQEMVIARSNYYVNLQEKTEKLLTGLEFRYHQQVEPHIFAPVFLESGNGNGKIIDMEDRVGDNTDSDFSNTREENEEFDILDRSELSECSSVSDSEEETNADELIRFSNGSVTHEQRYLSVLRFFKCGGNPLPKPIESEQSLPADNKLHAAAEKKNGIDQMSLFQNVAPFGNLSTSSYTWAGRGSYVSGTPHFSTENQWLKRLANESGYSDLNTSSSICKTNMVFLRGDLPPFTEKACTQNSLIEEALHINDNRASDIFSILPRESHYESEFLKGSPNSWTPKSFHLVSKPLDVGSLAYFNFSAVVDPCTISLERVDASIRPDLRLQFLSSSNDVTASVITHEKEKKDGEAGVILHNDTGFPSACSPSNFKEHAQDATLPAVVCGASSWEKLLSTYCHTSLGSPGGHRESLRTVFEIPLDYIVDKCLMQEISLQYKYVSKLVIKLLEEGFDLRVHLQAMRRYFFMESADWADLFLLSLQDHRWSVMEVNQKVPEIQGILELSLQRSSCERDPNKDRLFVYTKGSESMPSSTIGVNSFDFLGLGYRIAWPISIILTPTALKMYAQIFSFLMKVKLAVSSLTDIWCSLKEIIQLIRGNRSSAVCHREGGHWNMLINLRHKLNHFVCTIQQYVQSQLSHVSWCKFLHSLNYKVKDMMDLELVHMTYLTDSLDICFLSEEARCVAGIIENMLQCALDFKSCIIGAMSDVRLDQESLPGNLSKINVSQVKAINRKFESNLKELHLCYLKSPKHGDVGLSCFWGYLNYNNHYSDLNSGMAFLAF